MSLPAGSLHNFHAQFTFYVACSDAESTIERNEKRRLGLGAESQCSKVKLWKLRRTMPTDAVFFILLLCAPPRSNAEFDYVRFASTWLVINAKYLRFVFLSELTNIGFA